LGGILSERQTDIDTIHAAAGLLLQAAAERVEAGRADESALSDDQFRELVRKRLVHIKVPTRKAAELWPGLLMVVYNDWYFLYAPERAGYALT
jgi:hypothetical protein